MTCGKVVIGSSGATVKVGSPTKTVVLDRRTVQKINDHRPRVTVSGGASTVVSNRTATVVTGGAMGIQGIPGETEGATFTVPAGEAIHGGRVVRLANGQVFHPNLANNDHAAQVAGIALNSASLGQDVVVRAAGQMTEGYWAWSPGGVWCGEDGQLTQTPSFGWLLQVGRVNDATTITVDVETPIYRS